MFLYLFSCANFCSKFISIKLVAQFNSRFLPSKLPVWARWAKYFLFHSHFDLPIFFSPLDFFFSFVRLGFIWVYVCVHVLIFNLASAYFCRFSLYNLLFFFPTCYFDVWANIHAEKKKIINEQTDFGQLFQAFPNHFFACGLNQFIHIQKNVACNHCSNACIRYRVYQAKQNLLYRSYSVYMLFFCVWFLLLFGYFLVIISTWTPLCCLITIYMCTEEWEIEQTHRRHM